MRRALVEEELTPGASLPAGRDLATALGVGSRELHDLVARAAAAG